MEVTASGHFPVAPCVEVQLSVRRGREAVTFYEAAFGAQTCFRLGRVMDLFGHHWEIGRPLGPWPPTDGDAKERP